MHPIVEELREQYRYTLRMYQHALEACTDEVWETSFGGFPFWREAYHTIFWLHTFLGPEDKLFHPRPFDKDIDPRLSTPPNNTCEQAEALAYAKQTTTYVDQVFETLSLDALRASDGYDESDFRCVYHRLMYGLRHGQHHVGKLTAFLNLEGVQLNHWKG